MYKVLLVDDEAIVREGLIQKIEINNVPLKVIGQASNGEEALKIIEKNTPDFIITDVKMPVMDGIQLIEYIVRRDLNIVTIIVSGYSDFEYAQQAMQLGAVDYLLKPIKNDAFLTAIDRAIKAKDTLSKVQESGNLEKERKYLLFERKINESIFGLSKQDANCMGFGNKDGYTFLLCQDFYSSCYFHISPCMESSWLFRILIL